MNQCLRFAGLLLGTVAFVAVGVTPPRPLAAADAVTLELSFLPNGGKVGLYAALGKGFYKKEGLSTQIRRGYGSMETIKHVAGGGAEFGEADAGAVIVSRARGAKVKLLGVINDRTQLIIFALKGSGIARPKDLEGRVLGGTPAGPEKLLFPAFAAANGVDVGKVKYVDLSPGVHLPTLVAGKVDAVVTFALGGIPLRSMAAQKGKSVVGIPWADFGLDLYSLGVVTPEERMAKEPDLVRRFVRATFEGHAWAVEHPEEATRIFVEHNPTRKYDTTLREWDITIDHMLTERTRKLGLGHFTREKMKKTRDLITRYMKLPVTVPVEDIYTNQFLPKLFPKRKS